MRKPTQLFIFILVWLIILGAVFWWWQGRDKTKEAELPEVLEESGKAAISETKPLKTEPIKELKTPGEVAVAFFDYLNQKKYSEAEKLLTPESLNAVNSEGGLEKVFGTPPSPDGVHPVEAEVVNEETFGDTSEVWLLFYFSNGEKVKSPEPMNLVKIKGKWKLLLPQQ